MLYRQHGRHDVSSYIPLDYDHFHARRVELARRVDAAWILSYKSSRVLFPIHAIRPRVFPTHAIHDVIRLVHGICIKYLSFMYYSFSKNPDFFQKSFDTKFHIFQKFHTFQKFPFRKSVIFKNYVFSHKIPCFSKNSPFLKIPRSKNP